MIELIRIIISTIVIGSLVIRVAIWLIYHPAIHNIRARWLMNLKYLPVPYPTGNEGIKKMNMTDKAIEDMLLLLKKKIPKATQKNVPFQPNSPLNFAKKYSSLEEKNEILQKKLQAFSDDICDFLMMPEKVKVMIMNHDFNNAAGRFVFNADFKHIEISNASKYAIDQLLAVICHEICHYFLLVKHNIFYIDEKNNELLTEICAAYLGLGFYLYKGYQEFELTHSDGSNIQKTKTEIGYVTRSTIRQAIIQTVKIRKQQPIMVAEMFETWSDKQYAKNALSNEIEMYKIYKKNQTQKN